MNAQPETLENSPEWPSQTAKKLGAHLRGLVGKAIEDYRMIADGDRVMVCLSGGKDSYTLWTCCCRWAVSAHRFDHRRQPRPEAPVFRSMCCNYLRSLGVPFHVIEQDTYSVVKRVIPEGRPCAGCVAHAAARVRPPRKTASPRSRSGTIATTSSRRCSSTCSTAAASGDSAEAQSDDGRHI
jgi:hypothetical protein